MAIISKDSYQFNRYYPGETGSSRIRLLVKKESVSL
jgi:hypothetical protein